MKTMTLFEKIIVVILSIATIIGVFAIGYTIGNNKPHNVDYFELYNLTANQRDRLSDYVRMYEDMQFCAADSISLRDFIDNMEKEDAMYNDMPYMSLDNWCYAY